MRKKDIKNIFWKVICYIFFAYACLGGIIILEIHRYVSFLAFWHISIDNHI